MKGKDYEYKNNIIFCCVNTINTYRLQSCSGSPGNKGLADLFPGKTEYGRFTNPNYCPALFNLQLK